MVLEGGSGPRHGTALLIAILLLAAALRLVWLDRSPPGLQVDEASNIWNAWCLLKTGMDEHMAEWPLFYTRSFGDNRSSLFLYFLMPFEAMGGMSPWVGRLPGALAGVAAVGLIYWVGRRMFGATAGMVAAALLAVDPWHLFSSRWAHESTLCPMLVLGSLAALLWAGAPVADEDHPPRPVAGFVAGALVGLSCWGYAAIRLFLPVFLLGAALVTAPAWVRRARTRRGIRFLAALVLGFALTFGPLVYKHLSDPQIMLRGRTTWVWEMADSPLVKLQKVLARYPGHFGLDFLFLRGSLDPATSPPSGFGQMHWYMLPLLLLGLGAALWRARASRAARVLLVAVAAYPAGDLLNRHEGMNALRSLPGLAGLVLLGAFGAVTAGRYLLARRRAWGRIACGLLGLAVLVTAGIYLPRFFGSYNRNVAVWRTHNVDVQEACQWLRPRLADVDAVFFTQQDMSYIYASTLVHLGFDPEQWFTGGTARIQSVGTKYANADLCLHYGKLYFLYDVDWVRSALAEYARPGSGRRVVYIVRPGEMGLEQQGQPVYEIRDPAGRASLRVFDVRY